MRVVRVREFGAPEVLRVEEAAVPEPAAGQVVVEVELAGVSYGETIVRSGSYPMPLPYHPGAEIGGRIAAVGPGVDPGMVGRRVLATTIGGNGGYAEAALAEVGNVFDLPPGLSLAHALAVFQAGTLAAGLLAAMRVAAGETVLITAAAGRIGSALVQLAKAAGATVVGAAGGPDKRAAVADLGADHAIDYRAAGWVDRVKEATNGRGADVVLDAVGGDVGDQALSAVADGGRLGIYGYASGRWLTIDQHQVAIRGLSVMGPLGIVFAKPADEVRADTEHVLAAAAAGTLVPRIHATYPLEQAARAHADLASRTTIGVLLLKP
jgi:NADPH:quinone reductase